MDRSKVMEVNLEYGNPTVESALLNMANALATYKRRGVKAVVLIHGYGSSGVGGGIRAAVRKKLSDNSMRGLIRLWVGGEDWLQKKRELCDLCKALEPYGRRIANNEGITVVIFK